MRPAFLYHLVHTQATDPYQNSYRGTPGQALAPATTPEAKTRHATRPACR